MKKENQVLLEAASTVARTLACNGLLLSAEVIEDGAALKAIVGEQKVILVAHDEESLQRASQEFPTVLRVPAVALHRTAQIKVAVVMGLAAPDHLYVQPPKGTPAVILQRLKAEVDELLSFIGTKANRCWVWIAMDATTSPSHRLLCRRPQSAEHRRLMGADSRCVSGAGHVRHGSV